ncbi:Smr/MutS family protein [Hydrotalea sp.]|uniref:Smr/MutS family protein n=2 Tax=Hydrotalea sp. TaxID=2881279 RepID=UPI00260C4F5C|nr:Smr/MutS family protein [Hydrotalea sp.]
MKYQVGDEIIVLHNHETGKVIEIINDKMVLIEVRGVQFPAYMDQIDFPYFYRFSKQRKEQEVPKSVPKTYIDQIPKEKPLPNKAKVADGVWLSLLPVFTFDEFNDEIVEKFRIYLLNRTELVYQFEYSQHFMGNPSFELKNNILPFHDFYLHDIDFAAVNDTPSFHFTFFLQNPQKNKAPYFEISVKIKSKQLFLRIEALKSNNQSAIEYLLFDHYPDKAPEAEKFELSGLAAQGYKIYEAKKIRENLAPPRSEVDLHMEKLLDNWKYMSNYDILMFQLKEFEKWYELAVAHRQPSLIIIHGVGSGKLRDEIHAILKTRKEVKTFVNQYHPRYGYGATEIYFQY